MAKEERLYITWWNMKARCFNKNSPHYKNYGKRGIKIHKKWLKFHDFRTWALNNGYNESLTINRINNDGNYEPSNCRWSTRKEQANNRRTSRYIKYQNKVKTLQEWIEYFGLKGSTVRQRYYVYRFPLEKCFK